MEFSFCETFYWISLFYSQGNSLGLVPGPKKQFYIEPILFINCRYYKAFLTKNTFNNTGEKNIAYTFYGFACSFYFGTNFGTSGTFQDIWTGPIFRGDCLEGFALC